MSLPTAEYTLFSSSWETGARQTAFLAPKCPWAIVKYTHTHYMMCFLSLQWNLKRKLLTERQLEDVRAFRCQATHKQHIGQDRHPMRNLSVVSLNKDEKYNIRKMCGAQRNSHLKRKLQHAMHIRKEGRWRIPNLNHHLRKLRRGIQFMSNEAKEDNTKTSA